MRNQEPLKCLGPKITELDAQGALDYCPSILSTLYEVG